MKRSLYATSFEDLSSWLAGRKEKPFRARQVFDWAYQKGARSFQEMTSLPGELREALAEAFEVGPPPVLKTARGSGVTKLLLGLPRGGQVECVRIRMGNTYTACLSTQVGCAMGCVFCATGQTECERSLKVEEMAAQLVALAGLPTAPAATAAGAARAISNVVFMGMGEPFMNYANLVGIVRLLTDKHAFGMSPSRITVSTVGIVPGIRRWALEGLPTELTVSLNAPNDALRRELMPAAGKWRIEEVVAACREYTEATGGQPVTYAYVLIEGVNDLLDHARELAQLLRRERHHVNLIPLNPVAHLNLRAPTRQRVTAFVALCRTHGLNVSVRQSKGSEQQAACGQLRGAP